MITVGIDTLCYAVVAIVTAPSAYHTVRHVVTAVIGKGEKNDKT